MRLGELKHQVPQAQFGCFFLPVLFLSTKNRRDDDERKGDYQHNHVNELREQPEQASEWSHDDVSSFLNLFLATKNTKVT